jgi:hypothetical protein
MKGFDQASGMQTGSPDRLLVPHFIPGLPKMTAANAFYLAS